VDSLSADEIRKYRGTLTEPGRESPYRNRPVEENLDLFQRMRAGEGSRSVPVENAYGHVHYVYWMRYLPLQWF